IFSLGMLFFIREWEYWLVVGSILLTIAIQPHSWWDRFVPQMYALPVLILVILQSQTREYPRFLAKRWTMMTVLLLSLLLWNSSLSFMNQLKEQAAKVLLESKEMELRQSVAALYTGSVSRHGDSLQNHPPLRDNPWFRFYARHYLRQEGLGNLPVMAAPVPFDWEKTTVYYSFGWIYCLPRHETEPPQTENDVFLDYSDVNYSELPKALKTVGKVRWRQFCNAWRTN
ncbi:MAG: hypothetical protein Q4E67_01545, partial [Planctomycetia bacterium]|nr:hypothetical protein [Planctomycetia bacterium]